MAIALQGCSRFLFYPTRDWQFNPHEYGYEYENIFITSFDGTKLNAWLMPHRTDRRQGAVLYFHGNAQNIGSHVAQVYWLTDKGYDVFLVDYRGYGKSEGDVSFEKSLKDISASIDNFLKRYDNTTPKHLLGQSLGAAMSGYVIATSSKQRQQFSTITLDSAFADYRQETQEVLSRNWLTWALQYPVSWGMPQKENLQNVIGEISPTPLLIIHGINDTLVESSHGKQLFKHAKEPKFLLTHQGGHISAFNTASNRERFVYFLEKLSLPQ